MMQKRIFVLIILTQCAFVTVKSQGMLELLPKISKVSKSVSISGSIRGGASALAQAVSAATSASSQLYTVSGNASSIVNGGTSTFLSSKVNGETLKGSKASNVNGGVPEFLQTATVNGGKSTSTVNGASSSLSQFSVVRGAASDLLQSSAANSYSSALNNNPSTNPKIEQFAHSLTKLLKTSDAIPAPGNSLVFPIYETILDFGNSIFKRVGIVDQALVEHTARVAESVNVLTLNLYYSAMSHAVAKILDLKGLLTQDLLLYGPYQVMGFVEGYAKANGARDSKAVVSAVYNGVYNWVDSLGLANVEDVKTLYLLFENYVARLARGELE